MLGPGLGQARLDGGGLRRGAFLPFGPRSGIGRDRGEAALGKLDFAGERLGLGACFRETAAVGGDDRAGVGELGLERRRGRQAIERKCGGGARLLRFRERGGDPGLGFGEGRATRGDAVQFALGGGMAVAGGVGLALRCAPAIAGGVLGLAGRRHFRFGHGHRLTAQVEIGAHDPQLRLDIGEAVAAGEATGSAGRRQRGDGETVPTPQVAFPRHQPLAWLEFAGEACPIGAGDDADLRQPPRHRLRRRGDEGGQRRDAGGQHGVGGILERAGPMDRRGRLDRRVEVVAERRAERGLVAFLDGEQVDHRRPHLLVLDMEQARQRLGLGFEAVGVALGFAERLARDVERLAGGRLRRLGAHGIGVRGGHCGLRCGHRGGKAFEIDGPGGSGNEGVELGGDLAVLALQPGAALVAAADGGFELGALGREVGERCRQFAEAGLAGGECPACRADPHLDAGATFGARRSLAQQRFPLRLQARQRRLGIGAEPLLALPVLSELYQPPRQFGDALLGQRRLALQGLAGDHEARQHGGRPGLALAQCRQFGRRIGLAGRGFGFGAGAVGHLAHACGVGGFRLGHLGPGLRPGAGETAPPRPCGCSATACGTAPPAGPGASARRSGRRAGRSRLPAAPDSARPRAAAVRPHGALHAARKCLRPLPAPAGAARAWPG